MINDPQTQKILKKRWSKIERDLLEEAYLKGASLRLMSKLLGRSSSAINKALERFNIRPMGARPGPRPLEENSLSVEGLMSLLEKRPSLNKDSLPPSAPPASHKKVRRKPGRPLSSSSVLWKNLEKPRAARSTASCFAEHWVKMDRVLSYLKAQGFSIEPAATSLSKAKGIESQLLDQQKASCSDDLFFLLNEEPMSVTQILLVANRRRLQHGLAPFSVPDITQT